MKWNIQKPNDNIINMYNKELNTNDILSSILINRDIKLDDAYKLLNSPYELLNNPYELHGVTEAIDTILKHIDNNSEIHIFADFDVDGITSGFVMTDGLQKICNNNIYPYYPERTEGFGINMSYVNAAIERNKHIDHDMLIITVDNGTTRVNEINKLIDNGIDVIVTDHHEPKEELPKCTIVNPFASNDIDFQSLSGCGVVFQILYALYGKLNIPFVDDYLYATTLGTIADIMPLDINNLALCKMGMDQLNNNVPDNIKAFIKCIGLNKINSQDIAWEISPRLNACGRMNNIYLAANLFFCNDIPTAKELALEIEEINQQRKELTKKIMKEVEEVNFDNHMVCIYYNKNITAGLTGIIASRIADKYNKPAIVLSKRDDDILSGSTRSANGINILDILLDELKEEHIISVGGHAEAAGMKVKKDMLEVLQNSIDEKLKELPISTFDTEETLEIDYIIKLNDINNNIFNEINLLPYNNKNFKYPTFALNDLKITGIKESSNNPNNIKITFEDTNGNTNSFWAWGAHDRLKELNYPEHVDIAGSIKRDFMRTNNCTFNIIDIKNAKEVA